MIVIVVATEHMKWLSARHSVTANNIANVDTPGFRASRLSDFTRDFQQVASGLAMTHVKHMGDHASTLANYSTEPQNNAEVTLSGNDVVMERELRTLGENARLFSFDSSLLRTFHRMLVSTLKA